MTFFITEDKPAIADICFLFPCVIYFVIARYSKPTRGIRYAEGGVSDENYINYYAVEIQADIEACRSLVGNI
jgi:hypothetical protein